MTEINYHEKRRLLSIAKELMSDIAQHTKSMQTALSFVNSEKAESFHADEIVQDTIQLEMLLEDFKGDIPEEFEPFQKEVDQRKKMYGDLFGNQWYENRRVDLEAEIAEAASVPEPTEKEKKYMKREARRFLPKVHREKKEKQEPEKPSLEETGKIVHIYSIEAQDQLFNFEEDKTAHPLEAKIEPDDPLFSELPEHYKIICIEEDQQIKVDINQTIKANPFYVKNNKVIAKLDDAAESGKNMFRLQKLFDRLIGEQYE
ncbi:hypothetical protein KY333_00645 [Candidatus Woesearchaeota archaeon]|nr:hypothetical protein [Candidatus Woesearchaeota archaeon]MBW2993995.1 hypothetical protein [Candidatus Woesearchaeota archaeon]